MIRRARLPANLTQAQRDYFGAHTYRRIDRDGDFHTEWSARVQMTERNPFREGMPEDRTVARAVHVRRVRRIRRPDQRKLLPALYNLALSRMLPPGFSVVGFAVPGLTEERSAESIMRG